MKLLVAVFLLSATLGCGEGWQVQPDPLDALRELLDEPSPRRRSRSDFPTHSLLSPLRWRVLAACLDDCVSGIEIFPPIPASLHSCWICAGAWSGLVPFLWRVGRGAPA